jgi:hypothetical protein
VKIRRQYEVLGDNVAETGVAIHHSSLVISRRLFLREEGREEQQKIYKVTFFQRCGTGSGIQCFFDLRFRDPGWKKSGSGINNPDHISESFVTVYG